jgi:hypothetical protein
MTILFKSDWQLYPSAVIHLETRNKSFLKIAALYKSMGVDNHAFMLALHNPLLRNVDPFDPHLTMELKAMIAAESRQNFWFWIRECARAPAEGSADPSMVDANRGNIALWWAFMNHVFTFLIQIRQTGKSFSTYSLMAWLLNMGVLGTEINWLTKDDMLRRAGITLLKDIIAAMPRYLDMRRRDDAQNGEEVTVNELGNHFRTHVPQSSEKRALNQGRGLTSSIMVGDELPFQINCHISLPVALGAMAAAVDKAIANHSPYGIIVPTTAGKKDTPEGRFAFEMLQESAVWDENFFDCENQIALEKLIRTNAPGGVYQVNITMNHRQLGKSDEWLKKVLENVKQTGEAADRDYFNRWTSGSLTSPFDVEDMQVMRNSVREALYTQIHRNSYITRWYVSKEEAIYRMAHTNTIASLDTSDASGGDDISLVIACVETGETLCAGSYNETNIIAFAEWLCTLIVDNPKMTMIIERRSTGASILDYLMYMLPALGIDPFRRLYNRCVQEAEDDRERFAEISVPMGRRDPEILTANKKTFGFATSGSGYASRTELYTSTLQAAIKQVGNRMYDKKLVDQTLSLEIRNGRIDHPKGEHDDMVIGWLLAHWFMTKGKNLQFYGIDAHKVYRGVKPEAQMDPAQLYQHQQQQAIRAHISQIVEQLGEENDEMIITKLEAQLKQLTRRVVVDENEVFSVDELIRKSRETRLQRRRTRGMYGNTGSAVTGAAGMNRLREDRVMSANARSAQITGHFQNADNPDPYFQPRRPSRW